MTTIYDRLKKDHDKHRAILDRLAQTHGDSDERRALFNEIKSEVDAHAAAEEQTFYASLIEQHDGTEKARHSIAEHKEAADILEELAEMEFDSSGWLTRFKTLKDELEHHMQEEEDEVFPKARKLISQSDARDLAAKFSERKDAELAG